MRKLSVALLLVLALPAVAHAQEMIPQIDAITNTFQAKTAVWGPALMDYANRTFMVLAFIELCWAYCELALSKPGFDDVMIMTVRQILFFGVFLFFLNEWQNLGPAIINSIRYAGQVATGMNGYSPGTIFAAGVKLDTQIMTKVTIWKPEQSVGLIIAGLVIEACFAFMTAKMIEVMVESYFVVAAGTLFMAAGATRWTKDIAIGVMRTVLAIGAELFAVQLIAGIGADLINDWVRDFEHIDSTNLVTIFGLALVLLVVVWRVPSRIAGMIGGASLGGGGPGMFGAALAVGGAAAGAWGMAAKAGGAATGVIASAGQAANLTNAQRAASGGGAGGIRGAMSFAGSSALNMAGAASRDIGRRLSGTGTSQGSATWRQAADLGNRARMVREESSRPTPPTP